MKTNLIILEKKLASVNGLVQESESVAASSQPNDSDPHQEPEPKTNEMTADDEDIKSQNESQSDETEGQTTAKEPANPEIERFAKMLRVGVPLPAVRMKMISEGVDPDLLKV